MKVIAIIRDLLMIIIMLGVLYLGAAFVIGAGKVETPVPVHSTTVPAPVHTLPGKCIVPDPNDSNKCVVSK